MESATQKKKSNTTTLPRISKDIAELGNQTNNINESIFTNPFILPPDDQIFILREEEKRQKELTSSLTKKMTVWEKSKPTIKSRTQRFTDLMGEDFNHLTLTSKQVNENDEIKIPTSMRRAEKENMTEYIGKKREMFFVQMSLDTKREEIRKLEEKAQMKEEALQRSEQMLEEDAMRFDAFLKENDKKSHDAIKKAEEETKKKQEKIQEIKKLTQQIQALCSEMSKHKESLEDCMRYKRFLDMLTPIEWFEKFKREREEQRLKIQKERYNTKYKDWDKKRKFLVEQHRKEQEAKKEAKKKNRNKDSVDNDDDDDEDKLIIPPQPRLEDEIVELPEAEVPMYFKDSQQLMDLFAALEEQNLFLIQNSQETERTLEELQHQFKETRTSMNDRTHQLTSQITELQAQIEAEEQRAKALQMKRLQGPAAASQGTSSTSSSSSNTNQSQQVKERLLSELNTKVRSVYEQCGFDSSSKPNTLFMLSQLETKLESLLTEIEKMPPDYVIKAEKEKEKKRRERKREEQQALQIRLQEERNKRAIERSMQVPKKRVGRMVMSRSRPSKKEKVSAGDNSNENDDDEIKYLQ